MQEEGGSVFILLWAVSGHHYLTLQRESCKQMLVAHSVVIACVAVAAERTGKWIQGCWRLEAWEQRRDCGNPTFCPS